MGALTLLITGANGYLGRRTVQAALAAGHQVVALQRSGADLPADWGEEVRLLESDLNSLSKIPEGISVVLHLAASLHGDDTAQQRDTVEATKALLAACLTVPQPPALVLASSLSVYSGSKLSPGAVLDERSPLEDQSHMRDGYCRGKLAQELLCSTVAVDSGQPLQILRIGAIFGPDRLWNGHLGVGFGPLLLRTGSEGEIPLCHVTHAAQALILAAEQAATGATGVVNVVDDDLPDRKTYVKALRRGGWPKVSLPVPWTWLDRIARWTGDRPDGPGLLRRQVLRARMMPLRYANARLHDLGWHQTVPFETLMQHALEAGDE